MNFVIYDYETDGLSVNHSQVLSCGAVIFNDTWQVLDDPLNLTCRLKPGQVPSPEALLVNNISIDTLQKTNLSYGGMIEQMKQKFDKWSPAVFMGFNSTSFDLELQRRALWKNLYDNPYLTAFNGNSHFDLLGVARAVSLFFPKALKYKMNEKNNISFKLQDLCAANGIINTIQHSAYEDCMATAELAKLIQKQAPEVFKSALETTSKAGANSYLQKLNVFCTTEYYSNKPQIFCVAYLTFHPKYQWMQAWDLKVHPGDYVNMPYQQLKDELKKSPKKIRQIKTNKHPIVMPKEYALQFESYSQLGMEKIMERAKIIEENPDFKERVNQILLEEANDKEALDSPIGLLPEDTMYLYGFANDDQKKVMNEFHKADWSEKLTVAEKFKDERYKYFAELYLYYENPTALSESVYKRVHKSIADKILSTDEQKYQTIPNAMKEIDDARSEYENNKEKLKILEEINTYIINMEKIYQKA
jgi:exodeoxyribonuclease-1